jgi:hypothetical protein
MRVLFLLGLAAAAVLVCVGEPVVAESLAIESGKVEGENGQLHALHHANRHLKTELNSYYFNLFLLSFKRQSFPPLLRRRPSQRGHPRPPPRDLLARNPKTQRTSLRRLRQPPPLKCCLPARDRMAGAFGSLFLHPCYHHSKINRLSHRCH